jgi:hypothetical protein
LFQLQEFTMSLSRPFARSCVARPVWGLSLLSLLVLSACCGSDDPATDGSMRLAMTDTPACGYDHIYVTVLGAKVHQRASAVDGDEGWYSFTTPAFPKRVDLLALNNGALEELGQVPLPAGTYTQLRLLLAPSGAQAPFANAVVISGGAGMPASERLLTTPSAQQSGLKLNVNLQVQANQMADFVLDFNACKSVVVAGNSGKHLLKPVMAVFPRMATGMAVDGYLGNWTAQTAVSLQLNGAVVRSTVPNAGGYFMLPYLPSTGSGFDLVVSTPDRGTQVVTSVPVTGTAITRVGSQAAPVVLAASAGQSLSGNASVGTGVPDATLEASQLVGVGRSVELASRRVDSETGGYSFVLPTAPASTAPYAAAPAGLSWSPYAASAALYTVRSAVPGLATQTGTADLSGGPVVLNFAY